MKISDTIKNPGLFAITLTIILVALEGFFRFTGRYMAESEKRGDKFYSAYCPPIEKHGYHIYNTHEINSQTLQEYSYAIYANNEGLLDTEFTLAKDPNTFIIFVILYSFIEGMGASAESTCPKQLERILRAHFAGNPMDSFIKFCYAKHIPFADVKNCLETNDVADTKAFKIYSPIDMHFNNLGYACFAQSLSAQVIVYIDSPNKYNISNNNTNY